ncbi:MAG: 16S rRNA (cytosine(967)-C(5))-methyltransferase RsmB [Clostridia bacterium]|nr:16S rRNA (cytosine(967)-C(5))-methyltransferase RsmB [Clostridia bacterium]
MTAREAALKALYSIETSGAYTNAALKEALSHDGLSVQDKGFVTEIIYGVISNKTAVDYIISRFSKIKLKKMTPWVLNILRMGIYQIYYMDKIPHSAACNESVILAKKHSHGAATGFVNGVLRSASRGYDAFEFPKTGDEIKDLSLEYSYPEWITKRLVAEYGEKRCEALFKENRKAHNTAIRVNTLKTDTGKLAEILKEEGLECSFCEDLDNALILKGKLNVEKSKAYRDGLYSLQNISSQKAVEVLSPKPLELVIDMCAAPGGKSCAIAEKMENKGRILSFDIFEHKIELINRAAKRLGIDIIEAKVLDSSKKCDELLEKADRVLADVPCSGFGVIHKKPDIKWTRTECDIEELCKIQSSILNNAAGYVKQGGVLVYSTCTILPEENRLRIDEFLKTHTEFEKVYEEQILTSDLGESGFYICKMVKKRV